MKQELYLKNILIKIYPHEKYYERNITLEINHENKEICNKLANIIYQSLKQNKDIISDNRISIDKPILVKQTLKNEIIK